MSLPLHLSTADSTGVGAAATPHPRARFELPRSFDAHVFGNEDPISPEKLGEWLGFAGQRIGLGDWRPERSGSHGRFRVAALDRFGEAEFGPRALRVSSGFAIWAPSTHMAWRGMAGESGGR